MSRVATVWSVMRDAGALTVEEIAARCPDEYGPHQVAPIVGWLVMRGWAARVGRGLSSRYVNARLARWAR